MLAQSAVAETSLDRYGVLPQIQQMTISPDGKQVAFRSVTLESDVVSVISLESGKSVVGINVSTVKPRAMRFIDNDNLLMTVSAVKSIPGYQGELEVFTASTYNLKNKKYKQLLVPGSDGVYAGQSNLANVVGLSPDGKWAYVPAYSGEPTYAMGRQISPPMSFSKQRLVALLECSCINVALITLSITM